MTQPAHSLLRSRADAARVSNEELFFDLVYVFAVTQLSLYLFDHLTPAGALQTLVMWFAVWIGWQYTAWITNWFDPTALPIRAVLFKRVVYGFTPQSHVGGLILLVVLAAFASQMTVFAVGTLTTVIMVAVAAFEAVVRRRQRAR